MPDTTLTAILQFQNQMSGGLQSAIQALSRLNQTAQQAAAGTTSASSGMGVLGASAGPVGLAVAGATLAVDAFKKALSLTIDIVHASISTFLDWTQAALKQADELDRLNKITGINVESLQAYNIAADLAKTTTWEFRAAIRALQIKTQEALETNGKARESFEKLGIGLEELKDLSNDTEKLFNRVGIALANTSDKTKQMSIGNELMSRSFARVVPLLDTLGSQFGRFQDLLASTGGIVSKETNASLNVFGDKLKIVSEIWEAWKAKMVAFLIDDKLFEKLVMGILDTVVELKPLITLFASGILILSEFVAKGLAPIVKSFIDLGKVLIDLGQLLSSSGGFGALLTGNFFVAATAFTKKIFEGGSAVDKLKNSLANLGDSNKEALQSVTEVWGNTEGQIDKTNKKMDEWFKKLSDPQLKKDLLELLKIVGGEVEPQFNWADIAIAMAGGIHIAGREMSDFELKIFKTKNLILDQQDLLNHSSLSQVQSLEEQLKIAEALLKVTEQEFELLKQDPALSTATEGITEQYSKQKEIVKKIKEDLKKAREEDDKRLKANQKLSEMDLSFGLSKALEDLSNNFMTFRDLFTGVFHTLENSFSTAIQSMIGGGKKFKDVMKSFFDDIKKSFIKMISDMVAQQLLRGLLGLVTGTGGGFFGGGGGGGTNQPKTAAEQAQEAAAGQGLSGFGAGGLGALGSGATAGLIGGLAGLAGGGAAAFGFSQLSSAFVGQHTSNPMLTGMASALGFGGIGNPLSLGAGTLRSVRAGNTGLSALGGLLMGGPIGAIGGALLSSKGKQDAAKSKEEAE